MSTKSTHARVLVLCALAAVLSASGCATSGPSQQEQAQVSKGRSHLNLAIDYLRTGRVEMALREFLIAESFDPKNARIQYGIGDAYLMKAKYAEAEAHYRNTLELAPDFHDARLNLTGLLLQTGRYQAALEQSRRLVDDATFPAPWRALANAGWAEYKLGRTADARSTLELARDFNPSYWPTVLNLGILEMEAGRRMEAISLFRAVLEHRPGPSASAEANYRMGEIYIALGKRDRAVQHLMAAVSSAPGGVWGSKSEEYLKLLR
jgi:Tfp pilus assembly protein PilF